MRSLLCLFLLVIVTLSLGENQPNDFNVKININRESFEKLSSRISFFDTIHAHRGPGLNISADIRLNLEQISALKGLDVIHQVVENSSFKRQLLIQEFAKRGVKLDDDPTPTSYHSNEQMREFLTDLNKEYPDITTLETIGKSVNGFPLTVVTIHKPSSDPDAIVPQFKYIANMHGDETVGRELMASFALLLCQQYRKGDAEVKKLVETISISILPTMNPDGFARRQRENANGFDLNRNFDDQYVPRRYPEQPEMLAVRNWILKNKFVLSANFHGGAVVANYPWDGLKSGKPYGSETNESPDQSFFLWVSKVYADRNSVMKNSWEFPGGVTNGAHWYPLYGGMQDWNYIHVGCFEITIELSDTKYPAAKDLKSYWIQNKESLFAYLKKVNTGVRGRVTDEAGNKIEGAVIKVTDVPGKDINVKDGVYFRLLAPGSHEVIASAPGYQEQKVTLNTEADNFVRKDFKLKKAK